MRRKVEPRQHLITSRQLSMSMMKKTDDEGGFGGDDTQDEGNNNEDVQPVVPEEQPNIKDYETGSPLATSKTSPKPSPQIDTQDEQALVTAMSETSRKWARPDPQKPVKIINFKKNIIPVLVKLPTPTVTPKRGSSFVHTPDPPNQQEDEVL